MLQILHNVVKTCGPFHICVLHDVLEGRSRGTLPHAEGEPPGQALERPTIAKAGQATARHLADQGENELG